VPKIRHKISSALHHIPLTKMFKDNTKLSVPGANVCVSIFIKQKAELNFSRTSHCFRFYKNFPKKDAYFCRLRT